MDTDTFDRLSRLFGMLGTRRSALGTLFGVAALGAASETDAIKGPPDAKRTRRGKKQQEGHHRARAQAKTKPGNHCISPLGLDLNDLYDISAQIVSPFCRQVGSGEQWLVVPPWFVADAFDVVPAGFVPAPGATPLEDFTAKFVAVKYVIDPNSAQEQTVVFPNDEPLFTAKLPVDGGLVRVTPGTHDTLQPLSVGHHNDVVDNHNHVVDVYWVFSAMHCDGIGDVIADNCLPAGETKYVDGLAFAVTPGHN